MINIPLQVSRPLVGVAFVDAPGRNTPEAQLGNSLSLFNADFPWLYSAPTLFYETAALLIGILP